MISPAFAQTAGAANADGGLASIISIAPLVLVFIAFYFLMIRPQSKRMKTLQATIANAKKGDHVVTGGGLVGRITRVEDTVFEVELAPQVRVKVLKGTVSEVTPLGGKPAND